MTIRTLAALTAALLSTASTAADFSFTGTFGADNDRAGYVFTLAQAANVSLVSLGYAGGVNAAGDSVARGGFDTVLGLYDATGFEITNNDDGDGSPLDSVTGVGADAAISLQLAAGSYTVFLTQYNNFGPVQLPGDFAFDGQPDFRDGFVDFSGDQRTGDWALDIRGVDAVVAVPEPAAWALMIVGFGLVGVMARRRRESLAA